MFQKDYILRQIEFLSRGLAKMLTVKTSYNALDDIISESGELSGEGYLSYTINEMVTNGKINEAEDLLFENVTDHPRSEYLKIALDFYARLSEMSEEELKENNFSHQEVLDGLTEVKALFKKAGIEE